MKVKYIPGIREKERQNRKTRVAAYCRVSTQMEEQEESLTRQKEYYEQYIRGNSDWEFAGIYYDKKSGTDAKNREGFQNLITDALDGKIDVILCKSISRFSRNIVDGQVYARQLKAAGVNVIFEKEGLQLSDPAAEMMFALLNTVAQSESQSISDHVRTACEHRYAQGKYNLGNNHILGYDTVDGKLVPNQDAWIIQMIFELFLQGKTYRQISKALENAGARSLSGKKTFSIKTIQYILVNETHVGDKRLQKQPHINFLTKKADHTVAYHQYYLTDDHEGIVDRETWDAVQAIFLERKQAAKMGIRKGHGPHHFLYGKIFCKECGAPYVRRTLRANSHDPASKYKAWSCKERMQGKNGNGCKGRTIKEEELLQEISIQLGWEWNGIESFDVVRFEKEVERVEIYGRCIEIAYRA